MMMAITVETITATAPMVMVILPPCTLRVIAAAVVCAEGIAAKAHGFDELALIVHQIGLISAGEYIGTFLAVDFALSFIVGTPGVGLSGFGQHRKVERAGCDLHGFFTGGKVAFGLAVFGGALYKHFAVFGDKGETMLPSSMRSVT